MTPQEILRDIQRRCDEMDLHDWNIIVRHIQQLCMERDTAIRETKARGHDE